MRRRRKGGYGKKKRSWRPRFRFGFRRRASKKKEARRARRATYAKTPSESKPPARRSSKCGCYAPSTLKEALKSGGGATTLIKVRISKRVTSGVDHDNDYFEGNVKTSFKGSCGLNRVGLKTSKRCGVDLKVGGWYLLSVRHGGGATPPPGLYQIDTFVVTACDYHSSWGDLYVDDKKALYGVKGC